MFATEISGRASRWDWLWLLFCGALSSTFCLSAAERLGATFDEPLYVQLGLEHWRTGSTFGLMRVGTMPLPVDVQTLPLYAWERWRGQAFDPAADLERLLPVARAGNLIFLWLLLFYGWRIARQIAGPWGGRLAVAVLACEPNLLAHAGLATTDVSVAACLLMFCWHYRNGRDGPWWKRVGIPALCYAAAILTKASGLAFVPICALAIEIERRWRLAPEERFVPRLKATLRGLVARPMRRDAVWMGGIALALVFLYCGSDWQPKPKFIAWAQGLPEGQTRSTTVWLAQHLRIFNNAGVAIWRQIQHNMQGHDGSYLLGDVAPRAFWYYYPVALTIKSPVPLLLLPALIAILRRRALGNWACLAALALLIFSLNCRVQIGIRLVLPLIVMAAVGLSAALARAALEMPLPQRRFASVAAGAMLIWMSISSVSAWPHALCFTNELWGGPERGYKLLSDSNYDWGQGLKELAHWQHEHGTREIDVWYFGTDPAIQHGPFRQVPLHALEVHDEQRLREQLHGRYFAAGATVLFGSYCNDPKQSDLLNALRKRRPVARAATFIIFDMQPEVAVTQDKPE